MRRPPGLLLLLLCCVSFASCEATGRGATFRAVPSTNRVAGFAIAGDEVEPADSASSEPTLVGAFYNDGGAGDVRGRTENFFVDTDNDGLPDTRKSTERLLVHRGQLVVEVARPDEAMENFRTQVVAWGGHLQSQKDHTLVVRVPVRQFEAAFAWVRDAGRLLSESRQADDVTEEFVDLGIRLENARKSRDRLLEVLQKAEKVEDILKVEAELRRLTEEIERMEGRKKLLADQVALSTLEATFQSVAQAPVRKHSRQPSRFEWINRIGAERVMEDF